MLNKISTHSLLRIATTITMIIMCLSLIFLNLEKIYRNDLIETDFKYSQYTNQKYETNISYDIGYQNGKIMVASNFSEYQEINKKYKIIRTNELAKEDFEENNYVYVIMGEPACIDDFQYNSLYKIEDEVILNFTNNNCICELSSLRNRAYEIIVSKDITNKNKFKISFKKSDENKGLCDISLT